jgi:hypothetical protein
MIFIGCGRLGSGGFDMFRTFVIRLICLASDYAMGGCSLWDIIWFGGGAIAQRVFARLW